ncbi:MAG TPA: lysoplasmalogenase family protein [Aggregatilineales bacterium]|nr:lysoplasmalogenase family protein [Aggregatilineales bacterium]HPV06581.1 lysoplasmalogenase family protein [Aggregatilineales bacterium]HQA67759.1 lysoplasmalogenase family protein [Aggregatilineales bacterium]HQE17616.1 lysoplasmalogenase family protein [Aggregatilineales bacterium]
MFDLLPPISRAGLIGLVGVWVLAYIVGMVFGRPNEDRSRRLAVPARLVMIGVVLLAALLWLGVTGGRPAGYGWLIFLGLAAGAVGDLILADVFNLRRPVIAGMAVFGAGHVLYLSAVLRLRAQLGAGGVLPVVLAAGAGAAVVIVVWALVLRSPAAGRALDVGSLLYGALLGMTTALAALLWLETGRMATLAVGMALFLLSDLLLASYLLRRRGFVSIRDVVWLIYSAGQALIAFSIGAAGVG